MNKDEIYKLIEDHYRKHFKRLVKAFAKNSGSVYNAEDVIQTAYLRACEYWASFNVDGEFEKWFNQILNNSLRDRINEERLHGMGDQPPFEEEEQPRAFNRIIAEQVRQVIEEQPDRLRKILKLHFFVGYSFRDIYQITGEREVNVRQMVSRFRKILRDKFNTRIFQ